MAIEVIDQGDEFLILRSGVTGLVYGAMFDTERGAEVLKAAPIAEFMAGRAVTVRRASEHPRALPAPKKAKPARKHGGGTPKGRGLRFDRVMAALSEAGRPMNANELKEASGLTNGTDIYRVLKVLEELGKLSTMEIPGETKHGRSIKVRTWFPAAAQDGNQE